MFNSKKLLLPAVISCITAGTSLPTIAQTSSEPELLEEVVVTGIRRSLINSVAMKQESTSIVEAIAPEDIGKLPDSSIAESLARLPGLAGDRRNGRTSGISVRGFNEDYVATTLNGRELLGIGDNRGVEYDLYPSEIIAGALVYKTPNASLVNQGLGGIVDLRTLRPLESDRIVNINGTFEMNGMSSANPDYDDTGHRASFTFSDRFLDDTLGFAITAASMKSPGQEEQVRMWGYPEDDDDGYFIWGGHDSFVRSSSMERDTVSSIIQWAPNDRVTITADALYIDFSETKVFRGLEEGGPIWGGANFGNVTVEDGLAVSGEFDGFHSVIRNDGEDMQGELKTFGLNVVYHLNDVWDLTFDGATGKSSKDIINMESYSGVGRAGTPGQGDPAARSWVMGGKTGIMFGPHSTIDMPDYTDRNIIRLAGPQGWGGGMGPAAGGVWVLDENGDPELQFNNNAQDGFVNHPRFEEELDTLRLSLDGDIEFSIINRVEVGVNYSNRVKSKVNYGAFLVAEGYGIDQDGNLRPANEWANPGVNLHPEDQGSIAIPDQYIVGITDLSFLGLGNIIAYDGVRMYRDGFYTEVDATRFETDRLGSTYEVREKVTTLYGMADFATGILSGNIGLQIINTDQRSSGFDTYTGGTGEVVATPVEGKSDYIKLLPSLNLNFQVTDNQVVRFATSKTMSRARMDDMRPNNTIGFTFDDARRESSDPDFSAWSGSSGNTNLRPIEAIQTDLSYEYYFSSEGYLAATWFYKDLLNWHVNQDALTDFSDYIVPGYHDSGDISSLESTTGFTSSLLEVGKGSVQGIELQASIPFHIFSDALDGFGVLASATFLEGEINHEGDTFNVPGLSNEIYTLTLYYEKNGFEVRVSGRKRDEYLAERRGLSMALTPVIDKGAELWDAQIGYNFGAAGFRSLDGLTVTLQAQNLTNEDTVSYYDGDPRRVDTYQTFGANYLLGINYRF